MTSKQQPLTAEAEAVTTEPEPLGVKPTVSELGIDLAAQAWRRSGHGDGAIEVAFACADPKAGTRGGAVCAPGLWVLMRVAGDPDRRVLVFDRHEWECFLDGARNDEFDAAAGTEGSTAGTAASGVAGGAAGAAAEAAAEQPATDFAPG